MREAKHRFGANWALVWHDRRRRTAILRARCETFRTRGGGILPRSGHPQRQARSIGAASGLQTPHDRAWQGLAARGPGPSTEQRLRRAEYRRPDRINTWQQVVCTRKWGAAGFKTSSPTTTPPASARAPAALTQVLQAAPVLPKSPASLRGNTFWPWRFYFSNRLRHKQRRLSPYQLTLGISLQESKRPNPKIKFKCSWNEPNAQWV